MPYWVSTYHAVVLLLINDCGTSAKQLQLQLHLQLQHRDGRAAGLQRNSSPSAPPSPADSAGASWGAISPALCPPQTWALAPK